MQHSCPYITRIDHREHPDRYGNPREEVVVWSSVPMAPTAKGYDALRAQAVLQAARLEKATHPDAEVRICEA